MRLIFCFVSLALAGNVFGNVFTPSKKPGEKSRQEFLLEQQRHKQLRLSQHKAQVISYFQTRVTSYQDNATPELTKQIGEAIRGGFDLSKESIDAVALDASGDQALFLVTLPFSKGEETRTLVGIISAVKQTNGRLGRIELERIKTSDEVANFIR